MIKSSLRHPPLWGVSAAALSALCYCARGGDHILMLVVLALHIVLAFGLGWWGAKKLSGKQASYTLSLGQSLPVRIGIGLFSLGCCVMLVRNCFFLHPYMQQTSSLLSTLQTMLPLSAGQIQSLLNGVGVLCGLLAYPLMYLAVSLAFARGAPVFRRFLQGMTHFERWAILVFLLVVSMLILGAAKSNPIFFHSPNHDGSVSYRGVFSAESTAIVHYEMLGAPLFDDARHPLMGLIGLPFSLAAWLLAFLGCLVTGMRLDIYLLYGMGLALMQAIAVAAGALLLKRLLQRSTTPLFSGCILVVFLCSFPALFFSVVVERYAYAFFFLMLFLYCLLEKRSLAALSLSFLCAVGTLSTTAVLLPFFLWAFRRDGHFQWKKLGQFCLATLALCIVTGRAPILLGFFGSSGDFLGKFAQPMALENARQFLIFLRGTLLVPPFYIPWIVVDQLPFTEVGWLPKLIGGIVAVLSLSGIILGRKQPLAHISAYWAAFAVGLLVVVGLGAAENAMALYALYFSWAFLVLMAFAIWPLARRFPRISGVLLLAGSACMLLLNTSGWASILRPW